MSNSKTILTFFLFFFFFSSNSSSSNNNTRKCSNEQSIALLMFKKSLSIADFALGECVVSLPAMTNWKKNTDCCKWDGVTCNRFTGNVIALDLSCGMLYGSIDSNTTLFHLPRLQRLNLAYNYLTGSKFLQEIERLPSSTLTHLNISGCWFSGEISLKISLFPKLVSFDLSSMNMYEVQIQPYILSNLLQNSTHLRELLITHANISWVLPTYLNISSPLETLDLTDTFLRGKLPTNIFNLPNLKKLVLQDNPNLTGLLPNVNKSASRNPLEWLDLSHCQLMGPLPESLISLRHLSNLKLAFNMLSGTLPSFLFTLPLLQIIDLYANMFTGGLPSELFKCGSLKELFLGSNQFDGKIYQGSTPPSHIQLFNLTLLEISDNNFIGSWEFDTLLSSIPNLRVLDLSYSGLSVVANNDTTYVNSNMYYLALISCKLTTIPKSIRSMKNLETLDLSNNDIHGNIPNWVGDALSYLNLSYNSITGLSQFQFDGLSDLYLQSNLIQGPFPSSVCNMKYLTSLDISNNSFSGVIPKCVENMYMFAFIDLRNNHFHGNIPSFCELDYLRLEGLLLNGNHLEGEVPNSLSNCLSLKILDLGNNCLNGIFPYWLGGLPKLQVLILKSNNFNGSVETFSTIEFPFPHLQVLDLSNNGFVGHLPQQYFQNFNAMKDVVTKDPRPEYLTSNYTGLYYSIIIVVKGQELWFSKISVDYTIVDLSNNKFEGEISSVVGTLNSLIVLNLSHNNLNGHIPHALGNLSEIESLDISWNQLTGEIPQSLIDLKFLSSLNLSQNHLMGRIPEGKQFNTFNGDSYVGNPELCGFPLSKHCERRSSPQPVEGDGGDEENGFLWKVVMFGYGCGSLLGLVIGYLMLSTGRPKWFNAIADAGERIIQTRQNKRRYLYIGK